MSLEGKIAIVTGAGKGIGRDAALAVAAEGATVVAVARTQADLDETVRLIEEKGGKAISLARDLTVADQVQSMVDTVVEKFGRIDILVNNAGGYPSEIYDAVKQQAIKIWEWSETQWDQQDQLKDSILMHQQSCSCNDQAGRRRYRQCLFQNGTYRLTDGCLRRCQRRNRYADKDNRYPDSGIRNPRKCSCTGHGRHSGTACIQSQCRTG